VPHQAANIPVLNAPGSTATPGTIDTLPMIAFGRESNKFNQVEW